MAFGDFVQDKGAESGAFDTTLTATFDAQPTEGNLIVCQWAIHNGDISTLQDGNGNSLSIGSEDDGGGSAPGFMGLWYRIAGASQHQAITLTPAASGVLTMAIAEFEGPFAAAPLDEIANGGGRSANVTTKTSGTTAQTSQADILAVCGFSTMPMSAPSLDNSFTLDEFVENTAGASTRPYVQLGHRVYTAQAQAQTDSTWTGSADALGVIATFKKQAAAVGVPVFASYYRTLRGRRHQ